MPAYPRQHRLWIISELYYPEITSTGYYITTIAEYLGGYADVRVICGQPNYASRGERAARAEIRNNVNITRVSALRLDKNVLAFRLLNMLSLSLSVFLRQLASFSKGDSVLVVTTPPLLPFVTAVAALLRGSGYTLLVHDIYPEQLIATGVLKKRSIIATLIELMNRWVYKHARTIITVGRDMKELLEKKVAGLEISVTFIPNWAEVTAVMPTPREENPLLEELGLLDKFVVLSAGNFGRPNDLETILKAAALLSLDDRVQFVFIGDGARDKWLRAKASGLGNVLILHPMPRQEQNIFLNACDLTIASFVRGMWGAAVPSRVYNYMAAGKPLVAVCEPDSEMERIIDDDDVGRRVEPGDSEGLARAILELRKSPDVLSKMAKNARAAAVDKYSPQKVLRQFSEVLLSSI
jgi:colanic acid biosynthesis glycosyl transferase WcaI